MSKLSPKLHEEDTLSSLEMSSVKAGNYKFEACSCVCVAKSMEGSSRSHLYTKMHTPVGPVTEKPMDK